MDVTPKNVTPSIGGTLQTVGDFYKASNINANFLKAATKIEVVGTTKTAITVGTSLSETTGDKTIGLKYELLKGGKKGKTQHCIRIDRGNPFAEHETQRKDHVVITYNGQVIDKYGNAILYDNKGMYKLKVFHEGKYYKKGIGEKFYVDEKYGKYTGHHPDAHINLEEWLKWEEFYTPKK